MNRSSSNSTFLHHIQVSLFVGNTLFRETLSIQRAHSFAIGIAPVFASGYVRLTGFGVSIFYPRPLRKTASRNSQSPIRRSSCHWRMSPLKPKHGFFAALVVLVDSCPGIAQHFHGSVAVLAVSAHQHKPSTVPERSGIGIDDIVGQTILLIEAGSKRSA